MFHVGLLVAGSYFCILSLWWLTKTTVHYYHCRQCHLDFRSSATFPCCLSCKSRPVDGICKIVISGILAFSEFSFDKGYYEEGVFISNTELGTIFVFLMFSGVMDVLAKWGSRSFYQHIDYAGLVLFFAAEAAILASRSYSAEQPLATLFSLTGCGALACMIMTVVEAVQSEQVLCPLTRSYLLLWQGTWILHVSLLTPGGVRSQGIESDRDSVVLFSMFFVWHGAINFFITLCMWLLVGKLVDKNCCPCGESSAAGRTDDIFLENRVPFNYHVLDRLDSETE
ncbi:hypothetical protein BaRGS_00038995 [Batillaria attramentaria]|uniref:Transmembrane protein 45B n=1 Tax=Batillaria attramentaria TaxID=370345 RepID=A0ABD0J4G3_9CAEN